MRPMKILRELMGCLIKVKKKERPTCPLLEKAERLIYGDMRFRLYFFKVEGEQMLRAVDYEDIPSLDKIQEFQAENEEDRIWE